MATSTPPPLTGAQKAAIALMAVDDDTAVSLFRHLREDEMERVAREIAAIGAVSPELGEQVLAELNTSATGSHVPPGGVEQARRLLANALGQEQGRRVLERVVDSLHTAAGFASIEKANPEQLSKFFLGEHPQTTALILAHLNSTNAAHLLEQLPDEMRAEVVLRMAGLGEIPPDVIARVSTVIEQRLRALGGQTRAQRGGV